MTDTNTYRSPEARIAEMTAHYESIGLRAPDRKRHTTGIRRVIRSDGTIFRTVGEAANTMRCASSSIWYAASKGKAYRGFRWKWAA